MNTDDFRHLYEYHFTINRKIWERCIVPLTDEQFKRKTAYSVGSIRNQVVHMLNVDDRWFSGLRNIEVPWLNAAHFHKRPVIRKMWDDVETHMRAYLAELHDEILHSQPFIAHNNNPIRLWQVLLHVVNHGTDHRAQLLMLLNAVGAETFPQDYVFFIHDKM